MTHPGHEFLGSDPRHSSCGRTREVPQVVLVSPFDPHRRESGVLAIGWYPYFEVDVRRRRGRRSKGHLERSGDASQDSS